MLRMTLTIAAIALAAPAFAQTTPDANAATPPTTAPATGAPAAAGATAATPAKPNVVSGAQVIDTSDAAVGTIEGVANGVATLSTGTTKVGIPVGSFAAKGDKLVLALTKAQVDAQGAPAAGTAAATTPATITVGMQVNGAAGAKIGTVKAVNGDLVTVTSETASAQLPKKAFAASGDALMIGLTAEQFETAAKAAGGAKPPATKG